MVGNLGSKPQRITRRKSSVETIVIPSQVIKDAQSRVLSYYVEALREGFEPYLAMERALTQAASDYQKFQSERSIKHE